MLPAWTEVAVVAGGLIGLAIGVLWVRRPAPVVSTPEPEPLPEVELDPARLAFLEAMEAAGLWADAPEGRCVAERRVAFARGTTGFWDAAMERVFLYDTEELGECGPKDLLEEARPFLESRGVKLGVVQQKVVPGLQVTVTIDGKRHDLLEAGDTDTLEEAAAQVTEGTFRLLDGLLADAGAEERAYRLRQTFDATVIFLTPAQHAALRPLPGLSGDHVPEALPRRARAGDGAGNLGESQV